MPVARAVKAAERTSCSVAPRVMRSEPQPSPKPNERCRLRTCWRGMARVVVSVSAGAVSASPPPLASITQPPSFLQPDGVSQVGQALNSAFSVLLSAASGGAVMVSGMGDELLVVAAGSAGNVTREASTSRHRVAVRMGAPSAAVDLVQLSTAAPTETARKTPALTSAQTVGQRAEMVKSPTNWRPSARKFVTTPI